MAMQSARELWGILCVITMDPELASGVRRRAALAADNRDDREPRPAVEASDSDVELVERRQAKRQNDLLDEALKETFPASDPVSVVLVC